MLDDLFLEKKTGFKVIEIDNSKDAAVDGKWKDPGASLYNQLLNASWVPEGNSPNMDECIFPYHYLEEAYLIAPINKIKYGPYGMTPFSRSGCKYPHHVIRDGKLVIHIQGLKAAYARAKQMEIFSGEVKEHLERHYKELGLYEGSTMQLDESMEMNFQDIESYIMEETGIDLYSSKDLFEERSRGLLKTSFRYGMNISNGHKIKVIFDLRQDSVVSTGLHDQDRDHRLTDKQSLRGVLTRGSNDFVSKGTVKAIIDEDTNQRLKTVKMVGALNSYINLDFFNTLQKNQQYSALLNQCIRYYQYLKQTTGSRRGIRLLDFPVKLREKLIKHPAWTLNHENAQTFTVGEQESTNSYKATRPASTIHKLVSNMDMDAVFRRGFNSKGVNKNTGTHLKNKCRKVINEIKSYINTLNRRSLSGDDWNSIDAIVDGVKESSELAVTFLKRNNTEATLHEYQNLTIYRDQLKEFIDKYKLHQESAEQTISQNYKRIEESFQWMDHFFEAEDNNEPPPVPTEETKSEEISEKEEDPKNNNKESFPKKIDKQESDKNGVRRKKLYIAFIEWAKEYNPKNIFGSIFDKDVFQTVYPFVPNEMRYFYRLANPMLCVLAGNLTFFAAGELKKLNAKNSRLSEFMIFAATDEDLRVFNNKDRKIYRAVEENGMIKLDIVLGETFDTYIQNMINQGDILNGPLDDNE